MLELRDPNRKGDVNTCACMNARAFCSHRFEVGAKGKKGKRSGKVQIAGSTSKSFCLGEQQQPVFLVQTLLQQCRKTDFELLGTN